MGFREDAQAAYEVELVARTKRRLVAHAAANLATKKRFYDSFGRMPTRVDEPKAECDGLVLLNGRRREWQVRCDCATVGERSPQCTGFVWSDTVYDMAGIGEALSSGYRCLACLEHEKAAIEKRRVAGETIPTIDGLVRKIHEIVLAEAARDHSDEGTTSGSANAV